MTTEEVRRIVLADIPEAADEFEEWLEAVKAEARGEVVSAVQKVFTDALTRPL